MAKRKPSPTRRREPKPGKLPYPRGVVQTAARVAFVSFVRRTGHEKNAAIKEFDKQPTFIQKRWRELVQEVLDVAAPRYPE